MIRTRLDYDYYKADGTEAGYREGEESRSFNFFVTGAKTEEQLRDTLADFDGFLSESGYMANYFGDGSFDENGYESEWLFISVEDVNEKADVQRLYREWKQIMRSNEKESKEFTETKEEQLPETSADDALEESPTHAVVRLFMGKWAVCDGKDESGVIKGTRMGTVFSWHDTFEDADAERNRINSHNTPEADSHLKTTSEGATMKEKYNVDEILTVLRTYHNQMRLCDTPMELLETYSRQYHELLQAFMEDEFSNTEYNDISVQLSNQLTQFTLRLKGEVEDVEEDYEEIFAIMTPDDESHVGSALDQTQENLEEESLCELNARLSAEQDILASQIENNELEVCDAIDQYCTFVENLYDHDHMTEALAHGSCNMAYERFKKLRR